MSRQSTYEAAQVARELRKTMSLCVLRYTQERRKIEDALRKEIDRKRSAMVSDMLARLKLEFPETATAASPSPHLH